jgi:hypothetical protein
MRLFANFRGILSAIIVALLVTTAVSGECVACGIGLAASAQPGRCCDPDGNCKTAPLKAPPARCFNVHVGDFAVMELTVLVLSVFPTADLSRLISPEPVLLSGTPAIVLAADYSPPELHILNSALLI